MSALFGGGGRATSPSVPPAAPAITSESSVANRARSRRIGRAALIRSDQENILAATTGRNVLTAV